MSGLLSIVLKYQSDFGTRRFRDVVLNKSMFNRVERKRKFFVLIRISG